VASVSPPASSAARGPGRWGWLLYSIGLLGNLSTGVRLLAVPLYASHQGASPGTVGLLYAAFGATGALAAIPSGLVVDRHGGKRLLIFSLAAGVLAQLLAATGSLPLLFVSQALAGASWASVQLTAVTAVIAADATPARTGRVIALVSLANQLGLMLGPAIAGVLVAPLGFTRLFVVAAVPLMLAVAIVATVLHEPRREPSTGSLIGTSRELLARPGMIPIALLAGSVGVVWGSFQAYFAVYAARGAGLAAGEIGWLAAFAAFSNVVTRLPAGLVLDRLRGKGVSIAVGTVGFGAALAVMPHLHAFLALAGLLLVSVPFAGFAVMAMSVAAVEIGGEAGRGRAIGLNQTLYSVAGSAAPALVGPVMDGSFATGFLLVALLGTATAAAGLLLRQRVIRAAANRAPAGPVAAR
jgi:MFS family permease